MTWATLSNEQRIDKVRSLEKHNLSRTIQATRLGIRISTLSQFCSANGLTAANQNTEWTSIDDATRIARITELREDDGMSVRQIAAELGAPDHSMIYTFCRKHGLERLFERRVVPRPPMIPARPVPAETWAVVSDQPKTLIELDDHDCRWPVGEAAGGQQLFCGCRQASGSYCEIHAVMALRTVATRTTTHCECCGRPITMLDSKRAWGRGIYCSRACKDLARTNWFKEYRQTGESRR
jgi:hypothetical protein